MAAPDTHVIPSSARSFGIGELSARTGVSQRSLRYYEEQGLLAPERTRTGHRRFRCSDVDRVLLVQRLFAAGMSSSEIRPLLPTLLGADGGRSQPISALRAQRERLGAEIARMQDTAEILDEVIEACAAAS